MSREAPEGWIPITLGALVEIERASFSISEINSFDSVRLYSLPAFDNGAVPENAAGSEVLSNKYRVPADCILFSKLNPRIPRVWRVKQEHKEPALGSTEFWPLTPRNDNVDLDFLTSFLTSRDFLNSPEITPASSTNSHQRVDRKAFENFEMLLPPIHEQRRIAEILSSVDEAIAATRAVIEQTRKVKQGVLERLLTKGIGPMRFKQTEIGEIPEGWEVANLFNVLREPVRNGYSPVSPSSPTGGWLLSLGTLSEDGLTGAGLKPAPLDDPRISAAKLSHGDVLISRSNTPDRVGMVGIYKGQPPNCFFPDLMICLRFNSDTINADFGALWLRHLQATGYFKRAAAGTSASMVKINRGLLSQIQMPAPSIGEQEAIVARVRELQLTTDSLEAQLHAAVSLKSALMSDLLTGRKRVTEALPMAAE
jgi:type I restriction enzyme S subunit